MLAKISLALMLSGCLVTTRDLDAQNAKLAEDHRIIEAQQRDLYHMGQDLVATQQRLDNALRASADTGSDLVSEKQRLNEFAGRLDELTHAQGDTKRDMTSSRAEVDARLDDLKRSIDAQANKPPPITIPADKTAHFDAIESARASKDASLVRTLGREYVNRYPADERTDDVYFYLGDAELADNHPAAALGDFNHVLKAHPTGGANKRQSNVLAQTLLGMGQAYLALHDCENAKLAYSACASRFSKEKSGQEAQAKVAMIAKPTAGMCAPPQP